MNVQPLYPVPHARQLAVVVSINARAAHLAVDEGVRSRWVAQATRMLSLEGASAGWAISHCVRGMTREHREAKCAA